MQPELPEYRQVCLKCRRAAASCWCNELRPVQSRAHLMLLQHPREARNPIGTARMTHRSLPGSQLRVGVDFSQDAALQAAISDATRTTVILYPARNAKDARELQAVKGELNVVVIDGTWTQARKLWNRNPILHALPAYRLNPVTPGQYKIRKEPEAHCLSTIEAVQQFLDVVDGEDGRHREMLRPFLSMVDRQVAFAESPDRTRRVRKKRVKRVRLPPAELTAAGDNLLMVHGESNGWAAHREDVPAVELLQWDALRPSTGERFHALVRTRTQSPAVGTFLELSPEQLTQAVAPEEFLARWRAFLRLDDVPCTWGYYSMVLLHDAGGGRVESINLQRLATMWTGQKLGTVERGFEHFGAPPVVTDHPGRGSRRLLQMVSIVEKLRSALGAG